MASTKRSDSYTFHHVAPSGGTWIRIEANDNHTLQIATRPDGDEQFSYLTPGQPPYGAVLRVFVAHILEKVGR